MSSAVGYFVTLSLVMVGFIVACRFLLNLKTMSTTMDDQRSIGVWGPPLVGKEYLNLFDEGSAVPDCAIEYMSAYDPIQTVKFSDPADAYEYVVKAVSYKNKAIDRLESTVYKGDPINYDYVLIDVHRERDYWLTELYGWKDA